MLYLDANFFIFALLDKTKRGKNARNIQRKIVDGKEKAITSVLALDEIMWVLIKNKKEHLLRKVIEDIYATPNLEVKSVPSSIPLKALDLIEKFDLKPRDAFHVAMMEEFGVEKIVSDDKDFDKIVGLKRIKF